MTIIQAMDRPIITVIGYLLLLFGFLALILSMIGLRLSFLRFLEFGGPLVALVIKLAMIVAGFILMYVSKTIAQDKEDSQ